MNSKTTFSQKIKFLKKKSQPVSLLADSNNILIKITYKWGYTSKKTRRKADVSLLDLKKLQQK